MRSFRLAFAMIVAIPTLAWAQARWAVDHKTSLAWWQVDPHYEHLWATTCPADTSWQAGEGRDAGLYTDYSKRPKTVAAGRHDARIPLFPRHVVQSLCRYAVRGEVSAPDTIRWRGVRGTIAVIADSLFTGLGFRDAFGRRAVLETTKYPEIRFTIDSLTDIKPAASNGDTLHAVAVGTLELHGVKHATLAPVLAWHDPAGFRVKAQFWVPATSLTDEFNMSKAALAMGVGSRRWDTVHMGVDLILRRTD